MRHNRIWKRAGLCLMCICLLVGFSGCLLKSPEELYTLPKQTEAYYDLQAAIDEVITADVAYSAPMSGENRQPVQMQDLDGDGRNEAILFAKTAAEKPLKIYIFHEENSKYQLSSTIEGNGINFNSVSYAQLDGIPGLEIIVGRSISDQVHKSVSVYTYQRSSTVELLSANYSNFTTTDLDSDGRQDLFLIRLDAEMQTGSAELYRYSEGMLVRDPELALSVGSGTVWRMITGYTDTDVPAVFVASMPEESKVITDVFVIRDGVMQNIAASNEAGGSLTVRNYIASATDIDEDGLIELPDVQTLPDWTDAADTTAFRLIQWFNLTAEGDKNEKILTYHDYSQGIYMELDAAWKDRITIKVDNTVENGIGYTFNCWSGSNIPEEEIFTLYMFSGDNRAELAQSDGRFLLGEKNDVCYAASLSDSEWAAELTEEILRSRFHFIHTDWNSGEM